MSYAGLQFLFWRVFMRANYTCPPQIRFALNGAQWARLVLWSREALEWLDHNDEALDTLFIYPYTATNCALIQYHTWARQGDAAALDTLRLLKEIISRWEERVQPGECILIALTRPNVYTAKDLRDDDPLVRSRLAYDRQTCHCRRATGDQPDTRSGSEVCADHATGWSSCG
jgi:hypothetical protein